METITHCPVCKNDKFHSYLQVKDNVVSHETFNIDSCDNCGFKFTNPRPDEREIGRYYESENYIYHSNKRQGLFLKTFYLVRNYALENKLRLINSFTNSEEKSILDYGCGTGEFLNVCKKNGWISKGIETSPDARNFAIKSFGLRVDDLPEFYKIQENSFDIITLWHVLEHVHKLEETIKTLKKILKPTGKLLIAVPNCSSRDAKTYGRNWAAYDPPRHLYHFNPKDIQKLVSDQGMKLIKMRSMPFDAFYVSMISERFKTGKNNFLSGFLSGLLSNLSKGADNSKCSSIVYEITKS